MAAGQWWVIASTQFGKHPVYNYFQGTRAQAEQIAKRTIEVSTQPSVSGPFPTKAAAEAAVKAGKVNTPNLPGGYQQAPLVAIANPLNAIGAFFTQITKVSMWRSIAWILLGIILIIGGIVWWAKTEATGFVGGVIKNAI